jgi:hypothetical protein
MLSRLPSKKYWVVNERESEKTVVSIIIPSHMVGVYSSGEKIKYVRCEVFALLTTEGDMVKHYVSCAFSLLVDRKQRYVSS